MAIPITEEMAQRLQRRRILEAELAAREQKQVSAMTTEQITEELAQLEREK